MAAPNETRRKKNSSGPDDPTTAYARQVVAGEIIAGPFVRASCARHLKDLERQRTPDFAFYFDAGPNGAQKALDFFPEVLTVEVDGDVAPFNLLNWAVFVVGSLFGWKRSATGRRRFRRAYVEGGKGCAKTPLGAGIGLYMMLADGELSAEVYAAASKKDQAMILFTDTVKMVDRSPLLKTRLVKAGSNVVYALTHRPSASIFRPLSADKKKSGMRVSCGLVDELHEAQDRYTIDMLEDGFKGRTQPLLFAITNSGFDRNSICWEWHDHAVAVVEGLRVDEELFSYVMACDVDDEPLDETKDLVEFEIIVDGKKKIELVPRSWLKTNPGLGKTITVDYLRAAVRGANQIPGRENTVRRLNFCEWTDADLGWMTRAAWIACERKLVEFVKPVRGSSASGGGDIIIAGRMPGSAVLGDFGPNDDGARAECYAGLDLAFAFDLAALALVFPEEIRNELGEVLVGADKKPLMRHVAWIEYFTPKETAREREGVDRVPYVKWIDNGLIHATPGKIIRIEHIASRLAQLSALVDFQWLAYDAYRHKQLADEMAEVGVDLPWIEHPQGFRRGGTLDGSGSSAKVIGPDGKPVENPLWMPSSVDQLEARVLEKSLEVQESEVTRWQVSSVVIRQDPAGTGNRVFDKRKAVGRIDGVVALAMGNGAAEMKLPRRSLAGFLSNPVMTK